MKILRLLNLFRRPAQDDARAQLDAVREELRIARTAQVAHARRIAAFGQAEPDLHRLYFTRAGDQIRKEAADAAA